MVAWAVVERRWVCAMLMRCALLRCELMKDMGERKWEE
jgi:hypothetical protein